MVFMYVFVYVCFFTLFLCVHSSLRQRFSIWFLLKRRFIKFRFNVMCAYWFTWDICDFFFFEIIFYFFFLPNIMCFFLSLFVLSPFSTILIMLCNIAPFFRAFRRYNIQLVPFYLFLDSSLNRFLYFSNEFNSFFLFSHFFMMHYQTSNTLVGKQTQNIQFFFSLYLQYF